MPIKCPSGTSSMYRWKETNGKKLRLGGCGKKGRFIKHGVKEVKTVVSKIETKK